MRRHSAPRGVSLSAAVAPDLLGRHQSINRYFRLSPQVGSTSNAGDFRGQSVRGHRTLSIRAQRHRVPHYGKGGVNGRRKKIERHRLR
jgi:hypothetical protein